MAGMLEEQNSKIYLHKNITFFPVETNSIVFSSSMAAANTLYCRYTVFRLHLTRKRAVLISNSKIHLFINPYFQTQTCPRILWFWLFSLGIKLLWCDHSKCKLFSSSSQCFCLFFSILGTGRYLDGGRAGANGERPCSNSPNPPLCEAHFLLILPPYLLCITKLPNMRA